MIKISYALTVKDEIEEIQRLLPFLIANKREEDEIVILLDTKNNDSGVETYLRANNQGSKAKYYWVGDEFKNDFAAWKNKLNWLCEGNYIFQLDADEVISQEFMQHLPIILEANPEVDFYWVPRENYVEGITEEYIHKWGWNVDHLGRINYPDRQGRIYKNTKGIFWEGKVHEHIVGFKQYALLPEVTELSILHKKNLEKQVKQNNFYQTM